MRLNEVNEVNEVIGKLLLLILIITISFNFNSFNHADLITNNQDLEKLFGEGLDLEDLLEQEFSEEFLEFIEDLIIKADIQESGEILNKRGQSFRHFYNATTNTYTYQSSLLVYKENVIDGTNWITFNEYPIRFVIRLVNGSTYFLENDLEVNNLFSQISNSSLFGVGVESFNGILGFHLNLSSQYAHGEYLYYPRLSNGKLPAYNQPLYSIYPHLYARIGETVYDQILNNKSLYLSEHNPRNNLHFENTSDTFSLWFNTYNFNILDRTWDFQHGLKYNQTDRQFHLITNFRCRDQSFDDIGMAYEILSSPQSDGTPYQPSDFRISNETHEIELNVSQAWQSGTYLQDFYSRIDIISENGEQFRFSFSDMEDAGFTQKYLNLHDQIIPNQGSRKVLRAGMYGYGSYTANTQINIDPTFSEKQLIDEYDFEGRWQIDEEFPQIRTGEEEFEVGFRNDADWFKGFITYDLGITESIDIIENITMNFVPDSCNLEDEEYLGYGLYYNSSLAGGFWNETYGETMDSAVWNQGFYWNDDSFWRMEIEDENNTMPTQKALDLFGNWTAHHNLDPTNREYLPIIMYNGTGVDNDSTSDYISHQESTNPDDSLRPSLTFDYTLTVFDPPEINSPANQTLDYAFTDENITWIPIERGYSPDSYVVYRNGSSYASGSWSNQTPIVIDIDSINTTTGMHNFTIVINDTSNLQANDTVWIEVLSVIYPEINSPSDDTLAYGFTDENITWIPTERSLSPDSYVIYRNGSSYASGSWSNQTPIVISLDSINTTVGNHNFTIVINDTTDLTDSDLVWIEVLPDINPPEINSPANQTLDYAFTDENITWIPTERDNSPDSYVIYRNGSSYASGSWSNQTPIVISLDSINTTVGNHNFTIVINDTLDYSVSDLVWIEVLSVIYPQSNSPANQTLVYGATGENITWIPTERSIQPDSYVVYRNGSIYASGSWSNQTPIVISLDSMNTIAGNHNFTIVINDTSNFFTSDLVWITIQSPLPPEINSPSDQTLECGFSDENITWIPTERSITPDSYVVYRNGSSYASGSWSNQTSIVISLNSINLTLGIHNFTIIINDTSDLSISDLVWITIEDTTNPIINSPSDITYEFGESGNSIIWIAIDLNPNNYTVYKNGTTNETGTWVSSGSITIYVNGLAIGSYNFTIWINDTSGNNVYDTVFVFVTIPSNDASIFISWFNSTLLIDPLTNVLFDATINDIDNSSGELNVTIWYSIDGFAFDNRSVQMIFDTEVSPDNFRFTYNWIGEVAGTIYEYYYQVYDGNTTVHQHVNYNIGILFNVQWDLVDQIDDAGAWIIPEIIDLFKPDNRNLYWLLLLLVALSSYAVIRKRDKYRRYY